MLKTLRILAAFALALTTYALLTLLLRLPPAQARPADLSLSDQYCMPTTPPRPWRPTLPRRV
jgi:hypothetical protein